MSGTVRCAGGIVVDVRKVLEIVDGDGGLARVQTVDYSYNARLEGRGVILRYDAPHAHRPTHHVHRHNVLGDGAETIEVIRDGEWPTLGAALCELRDWYYDHYEALQKK